MDNAFGLLFGILAFDGKSPKGVAEIEKLCYNESKLSLSIYILDYYEFAFHVSGQEWDNHALLECGLAKDCPIMGVITDSFSTIQEVQ